MTGGSISGGPHTPRNESMSLRSSHVLFFLGTDRHRTHRWKYVDAILELNLSSDEDGLGGRHGAINITVTIMTQRVVTCRVSNMLPESKANGGSQLGDKYAPILFQD